MMRIAFLPIVAVCIALAGCDASTKLSAPAPAGTWTLSDATSGRPSIRAITFEPGGTFVAETSVPDGEARKLSGRWSASAEWREPSCWDRAWERPSQIEELNETRTGKAPERLRTSRAAIRLQHWVAKGADVPAGARVVRKEVGSASGGLSASQRMVAAASDFKPPMDGNEHWLLEENAELIRTAVTGTKTANLVGQLFAVMTECLIGGETNARAELTFRRARYQLR
jgi:hypothetical protein